MFHLRKSDCWLISAHEKTLKSTQHQGLFLITFKKTCYCSKSRFHSLTFLARSSAVPVISAARNWRAWFLSTQSRDSVQVEELNKLKLTTRSLSLRKFYDQSFENSFLDHFITIGQKLLSFTSPWGNYGLKKLKDTGIALSKYRHFCCSVLKNDNRHRWLNR